MRHFGRLFYDSDDTSLLLLFSSVIVFRTILPCSALTLCSSRYIFPSWKSLVSIMRKISYLVFYILIGRKSCLIYRILLNYANRKRIPKIPLGTKILSVILWPLFLFLAIPCETVTVFSPRLEWKPIPHHERASAELMSKK